MALSALAASLAFSVAELTDSDAHDAIGYHAAAISDLLFDDDED